MENRKKVAFYTLGCKLNFSETSTIARNFLADAAKAVSMVVVCVTCCDQCHVLVFTAAVDGVCWFVGGVAWHLSGGGAGCDPQSFACRAPHGLAHQCWRRV